MRSNDSVMGRGELERVRAWALAKIATGEEPPWAWYQYMKLREALDAILTGMDAAMPQTEGSPREVQRPGTRLRLVEATGSPDTAQPHLSDTPVTLPM
jgi:hypothetical protein